MLGLLSAQILSTGFSEGDSLLEAWRRGRDYQEGDVADDWDEYCSSHTTMSTGVTQAWMGAMCRDGLLKPEYSVEDCRSDHYLINKQTKCSLSIQEGIGSSREYPNGNMPFLEINNTLHHGFRR